VSFYCATIASSSDFTAITASRCSSCGCAGAEEDRDRPRRQRVDPDPIEVVELAVERDQRLAPEPAQQLDLLLEPVPTAVEVGLESFILGGVPPGADGDPTLGEDEDARHEPDRRRCRGEVAEEGEDLVERVLNGVRRRRERSEGPGPSRSTEAPRMWS
jgi:hypothetical protein